MPIPEDLKRLLTQKGANLAVAESASGGHLAALITSVSGSSSYFEGGVIAYSLAAKATFLNVTREHAAEVNCVSEQVAREMVEGVCVQLNTAVGLSITGYAENPPDNDGVPYCYVGFVLWEKVWVEKVEFDIDEIPTRENVQRHFAWMALEGLVHALEAC